MNIENIKRGAIFAAKNSKTIFVKNGPEILVVAGIGSILTGTVLASKATLKIYDVLDEFDENKTLIKDYAAKVYAYSDKDFKKDMTFLHVQTGVKIAKLYAPAAIFTTVGIGCMLTSNKILRNRNVALAAAYSVLDKGFKEYRGRVVEELGEEKDREFRHGLVKKQITVEEKDEKGKVKKVKKDVYFMPNGPSIYARVFDEFLDEERVRINHAWNPHWLTNKAFLISTQNWMNDLLKIRGHVFLNEVYDRLGFDRTPEGAVVGWLRDSEYGDGYIDFGIFEIGRNDYATDYDNDTIGEQNTDFINGYTNRILLDFNVDGNIHQMI